MSHLPLSVMAESTVFISKGSCFILINSKIYITTPHGGILYSEFSSANSNHVHCYMHLSGLGLIIASTISSQAPLVTLNEDEGEVVAT